MGTYLCVLRCGTLHRSRWFGSSSGVGGVEAVMEHNLWRMTPLHVAARTPRLVIPDI
jgi:hypothetical protein